MEKFSPHPPKYLMKNNPPKDPPAQLGAVQRSWAGETSLLCRYFFSPGAAAVPSSLTKEFISSIIPQKVEQLLLHSSLISLALLSIGSLQTFLSLNGWFVVTTWTGIHRKAPEGTNLGAPRSKDGIVLDCGVVGSQFLLSGRARKRRKRSERGVRSCCC